MTSTGGLIVQLGIVSLGLENLNTSSRDEGLFFLYFVDFMLNLCDLIIIDMFLVNIMAIKITKIN